MKAVFSARSLAARNTLIFLPCALVITLFLFYIDEGAYSLSWNDLRQEWGITLAYVLSIFIAQFFLAYLMRDFRPMIRIPLTLVLGIPLGLVLLFGGGGLLAWVWFVL